MQIIVIIRGKTLHSNKSQKKKIVCYEKSTKTRKENVKMSNNQEMSLQYTYIYEGKHWGKSPRLASEHKSKW